MQPDLLFIFHDYGQTEPFLVAVELKLFNSVARAKARFARGWGQVLTYGLYGFDGLALWHFLKKEPPREEMESLLALGQEVSERWGLEVWYSAGIVDMAARKVRTGWEKDFPTFVAEMRGFMSQNRCPLRFHPEIVKRRSVLKTSLGIPG